jgi:hypothetical protein
MRVPTMTGVIERRLLINYRVDPDVMQRLLPSPFSPHVVSGSAVAGICLIRLSHLRPLGVPSALGITTENAAHRMAVEWHGSEGVRRGVYIPRRDTSSRLTTLLGGRLFPGEHHRARFLVTESLGHFDVSFSSLDGTGHVAVVATEARDLPTDSAFDSLAAASKFFQDSPLGYSATRRSGTCDGLELRCTSWAVEPLHVLRVASNYFEDAELFPRGSVALDSALLMRGIPATWHAQGALASVASCPHEPSTFAGTAIVASCIEPTCA